MRHLTLAVLVISLMFAAFTAAAQGDTLVITEAEINQTYLVEANPGIQTADVVVDLRPGELAITATLIPQAGDTIEGEIVLVPSLDRGYLSWVVVEVLLDGEAAPDAVVGQINTALLPAWRAFSASIISQAAAAVEITDDEMTIVLAGADAVIVTPEVVPTMQAAEGMAEMLVFTEAQANDTINCLSVMSARVTNEIIDFQPGQVVIAATLVPRRGDTVAVVVTLIPETTTDAITWTLTELLIGGQPAPDAMIALVNDSLTARWSRYIRQQTPAGGAQSLQITDDQMIFVLETNN
ncbi:MAG: hypothetical protein HXY38_15520 [Chloroflexi bacterium]|nr:hypothetical protein [Chloroflexota bacterium]